MTSERRYDEDEVRKIFEAATRRPEEGDDGGPGTGLTLPELQAIGREVGLDPERIARASVALDRQLGAQPRKRLAGVPIGVGRTAPLPRAPTDPEWEVLVAEVRSTFAARGKVRSEGSLREWRNGNLSVAVLPGAAGWELRMRTEKSNAAASLVLGTIFTLAGLVALVALAVTGSLGDVLQESTGPLVGLGVGLAFAASTVVGLPGWADEREEQMARIAERAQALLS